MTQGIFSGLTSEQAFAIMNAKLEVRELDAMEKAWNPRRFWARVRATWTILVVGCIAGTLAGALGLGVSLFLAASVSVVLWGATHAMYAGMVKRPTYLRALKEGLDQFKQAAEAAPGAKAAELLAVMPV